jgi:hypothetical protein
MDHMTHKDKAQKSDPQAGHKMSDIQATHDRHAGHSVAMFRDKFWLTLILTVPILFWSTDVQRWFGYTAPSFPWLQVYLLHPRDSRLLLWRTCLHPRGMGRTCRS